MTDECADQSLARSLDGIRMLEQTHVKRYLKKSPASSVLLPPLPVAALPTKLPSGSPPAFIIVLRPARRDRQNNAAAGGRGAVGRAPPMKAAAAALLLAVRRSARRAEAIVTKAAAGRARPRRRRARGRRRTNGRNAGRTLGVEGAAVIPLWCNKKCDAWDRDRRGGSGLDFDGSITAMYKAAHLAWRRA